jgi:DNA-binding response OmpR family regulator
MTLQNKQMGLLADHDTADEVEDIFDQYGTGDDTNNITSSSLNDDTTTPNNVTRPANDEELLDNKEGNDLAEDASEQQASSDNKAKKASKEVNAEKKWEQELPKEILADENSTDSKESGVSLDKEFATNDDNNKAQMLATEEKQQEVLVDNNKNAKKEKLDINSTQVEENNNSVTLLSKLSSKYKKNHSKDSSTDVKTRQQDIKIVTPPSIDSDEPKEVESINKLQKQVIIEPAEQQKTANKQKKYDLVDLNEEKHEQSHMYVTAHSDSVKEATAATQVTAQMVKQSYVQPSKTDKMPKTREVHIDPSKKTIMIVDDDVDTLDMYADIFEQANYNVIRANDGLEAMSLVTDHTPHVVFTGIVMPRMDGFALMEALKQNKRTANIPVVINSHLGREEDKKRAEELGAKDFIVLGFTPPREVLERIGAMLLRSEYIFRFDKNDADSRKLARDLGMPNFFMCPRGQEMVLKLSIEDEKELTFSARFSCIDKKK